MFLPVVDPASKCVGSTIFKTFFEWINTLSILIESHNPIIDSFRKWKFHHCRDISSSMLDSWSMPSNEVVSNDTYLMVSDRGLRNSSQHCYSRSSEHDTGDSTIQLGKSVASFHRADSLEHLHDVCRYGLFKSMPNESGLALRNLGCRHVCVCVIGASDYFTRVHEIFPSRSLDTWNETRDTSLRMHFLLLLLSA
ncbi:hypothetical protein TNCV_4550181 [Trichonephila clavipes]|nr:hypothetical protein TNCV_4550181 [Trichonephila clavipes]